MNTQLGLRVVVQSPESLLNEQADAWDRLSGGVPFRRTMWLRPLWNHFGDARRSCFVTVLDNHDRLCGILPLERFGRRGWQTIGAFQCTDHVSLLCEEHDREIVGEAIAEFLVSRSSHPEMGWDRLHFEGVLAGDPGMATLIEKLDARNASTQIESRMSVWFRGCANSWDQFLKDHSRKYRHRLRAMVRQFEGIADPIRVDFPSDQSTVTACLNKLIELHQEHWQSSGEPGSFADERMIEFIHESAQLALQEGRLFFPVMTRIDPKTQTENVVAAQLHFIGDDGRLYCYTTGVNYEHGDLTPGKLLNAYLLHHAHQEGYRGIDFLRGDEEYKSRIYARPIPLMVVDSFAPTRRGRAAGRCHDWLHQLKQAYRRLRKRPLCDRYCTQEAFATGYRELLPRHLDSIQASGSIEPAAVTVPAYAFDSADAIEPKIVVSIERLVSLEDLDLPSANPGSQVAPSLRQSDSSGEAEFPYIIGFAHAAQSGCDDLGLIDSQTFDEGLLSMDDGEGQGNDEGPVLLPFAALPVHSEDRAEV